MRKYADKNILIIDDEVEICAVMKQILELEDYKVQVANNGEGALILLSNTPDGKLPHLILLDYNMPVLNGHGFNKARLQNPRLAKIPIVLLTANSFINRIMSHIDADAYVSKPINVEQVSKLAMNYTHRREYAKSSFLA